MRRNFTQEPNSKKLSLFLHKNYPGANFKCVYEAGFAGFNAQRELTSQGINCIVIHPADVPTTDKERRQKSDRIDSRKLVRGLKNGDFKSLYVPELLQQQDRFLLRTYDKIIRDTTRVKNRIKFFLMFFGLSIPNEFQGKNWTKEFSNWLERLNPGGYANLSLQILLDEYRMLSCQTILLVRVAS